jgi:WD40 repeat protein
VCGWHCRPDWKFSPSAKQRDLCSLPDEVTYLTQCPDRHLIFVGCANGELIVWQASLAALFVKFLANDASSAAAPAEPRSKANSRASSLVSVPGASSPETGDDKAVAVEFIVPLPAPADKSAQGALLVCCSDGVIRTWDLGTGAEPPELLSQTRSNHVGIMFATHCVSTQKDMLFTADVEGFLKVWDLRGDCGQGKGSRRKSSIVARPGLVTQVWIPTPNPNPDPGVDPQP